MTNMKRFIPLFIVLLTISCNKDIDTSPSYVSKGEYLGPYFPTNGWQSCQPENVGLNTEKLKLAYDYVANESFTTNGFLIIKDGYIVLEAYFNGHSATSSHTSYSIAKSFTSAAIGIAMDKSVISSIDDKIADYFPQLQGPEIQAEKKEVTIKHLLTMKAGFEWNEDDYYSGATNDIITMVSNSANYVDYVLSKPIVRTPGLSAYYSSGESMLLSGVIQQASGSTLYNFANEHLFTPLGIEDLRWDTDPSGQTVGGWGINTSLRSYAKFGFLYLNKGKWDNQQIVPEGWVDDSVNPEVSELSNYGYQWWIGSGISSFNENNIPNDCFLGIGIYRQYLIVVPSKNLVIVRTGNDIPSETEDWSTAELISLILEAEI
jgi:CubicO group peptidase (beta-lactamase class C family)